jgi:hypothetical protein
VIVVAGLIRVVSLAVRVVPGLVRVVPVRVTVVSSTMIRAGMMVSSSSRSSQP